MESYWGDMFAIDEATLEESMTLFDVLCLAILFSMIWMACTCAKIAHNWLFQRLVNAPQRFFNAPNVNWYNELGRYFHLVLVPSDGSTSEERNSSASFGRHSSDSGFEDNGIDFRSSPLSFMSAGDDVRSAYSHLSSVSLGNMPGMPRLINTSNISYEDGEIWLELQWTHNAKKLWIFLIAFAMEFNFNTLVIHFPSDRIFVPWSRWYARRFTSNSPKERMTSALNVLRQWETRLVLEESLHFTCRWPAVRCNCSVKTVRSVRVWQKSHR